MSDFQTVFFVYQIKGVQCLLYIYIYLLTSIIKYKTFVAIEALKNSIYYFIVLIKHPLGSEMLSDP